MTIIEKAKMPEDKKTFLARLRDFEDAAFLLSEQWGKIGGGEAVKDYPFNQSFDELAHEILHWRQTTEEEFEKER